MPSRFAVPLTLAAPQQWPRRPPLHRGEWMAKSHELQLERHAASEGVAELQEKEIDNRAHAGDAIQTRPKRPGFLRRMRLLGGTADYACPTTDACECYREYQSSFGFPGVIPAYRVASQPPDR